MKTNALNLYIVDDDPALTSELSDYLHHRFENNLNISTYLTGESALANISNQTNIVVLAYYLRDKNGHDVLREIKIKNPKTEVIMMSSSADIASAIEALQNGASDYVVKGQSGWMRIIWTIEKAVAYPFNILVAEFGVSKFLAIFLLVFAALGILATIAFFMSLAEGAML